jgi:urea transport system permease protein
VLGAISVNLGRSLLTNYFPELWPFILGGLFVVVVLLFPDGLVGIMRQIQERIHNMRVTALSAEEGLR